MRALLSLQARHAHGLAIAASLSGGALALLYALRHGPSMMGDSQWYLDVAAALAGETGIRFDFVRPPGYPAFAALVAMVAGPGNLEALAYVHCGLLSTTAYGTYWIARWLAPQSTAMAVAASALVAFNPTAVQNALIILTEPLVMFLTVGFALSLVRFVAWQEEAPNGSWVSLRSVVVALFGALLLVVRSDMIAMVLPAVLVSMFSGGLRPGMPRLGRSVAASLMVLGLCLPVVAWQSREAGQLTLLATGKTTDENHRGFARWVTTLNVSESEWKRMVYDDIATMADLPPNTFSGATERDRTATLLDRLATEGTSPALEAEWVALSAERIRRNPIGYTVGLPLRRSIDFWFFKPVVGSDGFAARTTLSVYYWSYALLFGIGTIATVIFAAMPRHPLFVLGWLVLLRTYSILGAGVLTGVGFYEQRYVRCVQPLVLLIAIWALLRATSVLQKLPRTRA